MKTGHIMCYLHVRAENIDFSPPQAYLEPVREEVI
jgi:hypothetical protein